MIRFTEQKTKIILTCILAGVVLALFSVMIIIGCAKKPTANMFSSAEYVSTAAPQTQSEIAPPQSVAEVLVITSPAQLKTSTDEDKTVITGRSDPAFALKVNGTEVERGTDGSFSLEFTLKPGVNTFNFSHKDEKKTVTVNYNYTVIKAYSPYQKQTFSGGGKFTAIALARSNCSSVTATFAGKTVQLAPEKTQDTSQEFINFYAEISLPEKNETDMNLGGITFSATVDGYTSKVTSPDIICLRDTALDRMYLVEIVADQAETFNGNTSDDLSNPTNSYLPKGTLDFKIGATVYDASTDKYFYKMRYGKRVYVSKDNTPDTQEATVAIVREGQVPDTNVISMSSFEDTGKHIRLTLNTQWKAPFTFNLAPQSYNGAGQGNFSISSATYSYIDIKFCYSTAIEGNFAIPTNSLFSSALIIPAADGYILRLHLNKTGGFYGWNCNYNGAGQMVFDFLKPTAVAEANNTYGVDLSGVRIVIDAGHGGRDVGALGRMPQTYNEAERNLALANKLKVQLESMGAQVIMTRSSDTAVTIDERCRILRAAGADLCISLHHDSSSSASANGAGIFCFNEFSNSATDFIYKRTASAGIYSSVYKKWHYFYLARVSSCPVVLVENGFISNPQDFSGIVDENTNAVKAIRIAEGVADYFKSIK